MADTGRWDKKDPNEALFYSLDWEGPLAGDTISSASWGASVPSGITIANAAVDGTITRAKLSGGVVDTDYAITVTVTGASGQIYERTRTLKVRER